MDNDTIVAISTPIGESAIGIVRMSGKDSLKIADTIFRGRDGVLPSKLKSHTVHYGWVAQTTLACHSQKPGQANNKLRTTKTIDEVLLTVMRAPKTYTREDIVEISCHGGAMALRKILELILKCGVRLAEPGEFTKRAFLNGRIDLSKAEAVLDIIRAKTDTALKLGIEQLKGGLAEKIKIFRGKIIDILANVEANIDFSEEDIDTHFNKTLKHKLEDIIKQLDTIIEDSKKVNFFREGIKVTICGRPNVGKSSLLNAILKKERAIVTPIAGTTRDVIEEFINIDGVGIRLVDTAGVVKPRDLIEHHAVRLAKNSIALSDIVLLVFDASQKLTKRDYQLIKELKETEKAFFNANSRESNANYREFVNKDISDHSRLISPSASSGFLEGSRATSRDANSRSKRFFEQSLKSNNIIAVLNKIDLPKRIEMDKIHKEFKKVVSVSCLAQKNIEKLEKAIVSFVYKGKITSSDGLITTNARQIGEIAKAKDLLEKAKESLRRKLSLEFIALDMKLALDCLGRITGESVDGEILDKIFSEFCIGK